MRRPVYEKDGTTQAGMIDDEICAMGKVLPTIITDSSVGGEPTELPSTVYVNLPLLDARWVAGRKVAIFPTEE